MYDTCYKTCLAAGPEASLLPPVPAAGDERPAASTHSAPADAAEQVRGSCGGRRLRMHCMLSCCDDESTDWVRQQAQGSDDWLHCFTGGDLLSCHPTRPQVQAHLARMALDGPRGGVTLNAEQQAAVASVLAGGGRGLPYVLWGPPGGRGFEVGGGGGRVVGVERGRPGRPGSVPCS